MPFEKGKSGNPGGRPKVVGEVQVLARKYAPEAIETLRGIMENIDAPPAARISAAIALLDRGFGRPHQTSEVRTSYARKPLVERKTALKWVLRKAREGIQYVEHAEGHGDKLFAAVCNLGLEGIVSKRLTSAYKSGPSRTWIKVKNPKSPAASRAIDGTF
jgi:hypothetical protein